MIMEVLKKHCAVVDIKRFDETKNIVEAMFVVETDNFEQIVRSKAELLKIDESMKITFLDNRSH